MSDFECLPIGTAERLADLEAENASLAQLLKDIPPFEAECEECFDKRHLLEAEVERLRAALRSIGEYTGEGPNTTPWQTIVRKLGAKARDALKEGQR